MAKASRTLALTGGPRSRFCKLVIGYQRRKKTTRDIDEHISLVKFNHVAEDQEIAKQTRLYFSKKEKKRKEKDEAWYSNM